MNGGWLPALPLLDACLLASMAVSDIWRWATPQARRQQRLEESPHCRLESRATIRARQSPSTSHQKRPT